MSPGYRPIDIDAAWPAAGDEQMKDLTLGPPIDLRTAGDLSRYFRDDIIRTAQTRYAP